MFMEEIILTIAKHDLPVLGSIRDIDGLKAAADDDQIWVRGLNSIVQELSPVRKLPVKNRFTVNGNGLLFPAGGVTPVGSLKELEWKKISEFVTVELPSSAGPGALPQALRLSLTPSTTIYPGAALLTSLKDWKAYGETASRVRLARLTFAVSENREVLIMGEPLPSLPGREYWLNQGMLIPSGYDFEFPLITAIVRQQLCTDGVVTIFNDDGSWFSIDHHFFVPATRSAIRMTQMEEHG